MAACLTVLLSGCGFFQSPADGIDFRPPNGWYSTPGIQGKYQVWMSRNGEALLLVRLSSNGKNVEQLYRPTNATPGERTEYAFKSSQTINNKVLERRTMTLCGNQQSSFLKSVGESKNDRVRRYTEIVASHAGAFVYMIMYTRPAAVAADPAAEAALYEVCPHSSAGRAAGPNAPASAE